MNELTKAIIFFIISMTVCFVPILHKNDWTIFLNGSYHKIL